MNPETIAIETAEIRVRDDGITQIAVRPNIVETLEDAKARIAAISRLNHGKPVPLLMDIRFTRGIDRETREYYSRKEGLFATKAVALLIESPFTRVVANFFISINKPAIPTRLFTSEDEAIAWLKTFL